MVELIDPVNPYSFYLWNDLTLVNFPSWFLHCDYYSPAFLNLFQPSDPSIVLWCLSLNWKILTMVLSQICMAFWKLKNGCSFLLHSFWLFSAWLGWCAWSCKRCSIRGSGYIFKLGTSSTASKFVEDEFYVYIPYPKYQIKLYLSPWFSTTWTATVAPRNNCFLCTNKLNCV